MHACDDGVLKNLPRGIRVLMLARNSNIALARHTALYVVVRLQPGPLAAIDDWLSKLADKPSRAEAIRRLVELGLKAKPRS